MTSHGASLVAVAVLAAAASQRIDVVVGFVVLGAVFVPLERFVPVRRRQPLRRRGQGTESCMRSPTSDRRAARGGGAGNRPRHNPPAGCGGGTGPVATVDRGARARRDLRMLGPPVEPRAAVAVAVSQAPPLDRDDGLARPNRRHPVDLVVARVAVALPLLALGFPVPALAAPFAIRRFQGLLVHANVQLEGGPLRWLVATPHFHHWHHAADAEGWNRNYAGQAPLVDRLFCTLVLPRHRWPTA